METSLRRNTEDNPPLQDGTYEAVIRRIIRREHVGTCDVVTVFLFLPNELTHVVAEINLPHRFDHDVHQQLVSFCASVELTPESIRNAPSKFSGRKLRIKTRRCQRETSSGVEWYSRVVEFLRFGTAQERNTELGINMIPHSGLRD